MTFKTKLALMIAVFLWASAFVGIRAGLQGYSPEGLALLRFLIASLCMSAVYFCLPSRQLKNLTDICGLLFVGVIGIGIYNLALNYGELAISSGVSSFIISQSPLVTTLFALCFLGERLNFSRSLGLMISVVGVFLISVGEKGGFIWDSSISYILIATAVAGFYSLMQKPFLKKYHAIEVTTYIIWGGTLFLLMYTPKLMQDVVHAPLKATLSVLYLGVFPAAIGYVAWSYALSAISASRAVVFLYAMPFLAMFLGWLWLHEVPAWLSVAGGLFAIFGVWLVNQSYTARTTTNKEVTLEAVQ